MFENLLKDYQWNNEELNSIENNELMIKIKKSLFFNWVIILLIKL